MASRLLSRRARRKRCWRILCCTLAPATGASGWPGCSGPNPTKPARGNLRLALWRINKTLGNACLRADRVLIAFDAHEACWIDVATLERTSAHASTDELLDSLRAFCLALLPAAGSCAPSEAITP